MLGIVNPSTLVSVEAFKKNFKGGHQDKAKTVIIVDVATSGAKGIAQHLAKYVINAVVRTTLRQCVKAD